MNNRITRILACALAFSASTALSTPITYELMPSLASGLTGESPAYSITGSITTDGTIGSLAPSDILSLSWMATLGPTVITSPANEIASFDSPLPPIATPTGLYLPFGTVTPQFLDPAIAYSQIDFFQPSDPANGFQLSLATSVGNDGFYVEIPDGVHYYVTWDLSGPGIVFSQIFDPYYVSRVVSVTMPSPYLIAAVVPEPSSLVLAPSASPP